MKRKSSGTQTVFWWVVWIVLTIASFFVAAAFWTPILAKHLGSVHETKSAVIWVAAVFGSWMVFLIPLIIVMYHKVDKAYEDARMKREKAAERFRTLDVDRSKRLLPETLSKKIAEWPDAIQGGKLVTVILKNGKTVPYVFVANSDEILGIYDHTEFPFEVSDITDVEKTDLDKLPSFLPMNWLRLDGVSAPE